MQNQENAKDQVELKEQENHIIEERLAKLDKLRQAGPAYPNDFEKKKNSAIFVLSTKTLLQKN